MSTSGETPAFVPVDRADELRADIVSTRAELADTLDHLMAKLDVKSRARHQLDEVRSAARDGLGKAPEPVQRALKRAADTLAPLAVRARPYRKQIVIAMAGLLAVLAVARPLAR
jgi:ElaB/YqjD/DUF883 family membrane-anchored ribosome-binding protein